MSDDMIFYNKQSLQRGRRKHIRFVIKKPVEFYEIDPEQTDLIRGITLNMSEGGMKFASPTYVPVGSFVVYKVVQEKPVKTISRGLFQVSRVKKNEKIGTVFEVAGPILKHFKNVIFDDWLDLRSAAQKTLEGMQLGSHAPQTVTTSKPEHAQSGTSEQVDIDAGFVKRRKIQPLSFCPFCGVPVLKEDNLCFECLKRTNEFFLCDRDSLFPLMKSSQPEELSEADKLLANMLDIIDQLGQKGDKNALPYLVKASKNHDPRICAAAKQAMVNIKKRS